MERKKFPFFGICRSLVTHPAQLVRFPLKEDFAFSDFFSFHVSPLEEGAKFDLRAILIYIPAIGDISFGVISVLNSSQPVSSTAEPAIFFSRASSRNRHDFMTPLDFLPENRSTTTRR